MEQIDPFAFLDNISPVDLNQIASCNEMMKLNLADVFPSWFNSLNEKTEGFYRKTYVPRLKAMGGIFNKKRGSPLFTVNQFNEQDHNDVEFMIHQMLSDVVPKVRPYQLCYNNLCIYLHQMTRGLFKTYKSKF